IKLAFEGRPYLPAPQVARLLEMDDQTLRRHVRAGDITWRQKGLGAKRPRRVFTLSDIADFFKKIHRGKTSWPTAKPGRESSASPGRRIGGTTSKLTVVDFTNRRNAPKKLPHRRLRTAATATPSKPETIGAETTKSR